MKLISPSFLAAVLLAMSAPAVTSAGSPPDGAYALISDGTVRGIVRVGYTATTTVNAGILGIVASTEYFVAGRSIGCAGNPAPANRVFKG